MQHKVSKQRVFDFFNLLSSSADEENTANVLEEYLTSDVSLEIVAPFGALEGRKEWLDGFWSGLTESFPDLQLQPYILVGGEYKGATCVSATGNIIGTFTKEWIGIPSNDQPVWLRFATHFIMSEGKIAKAWFFIDILDVIRQAGFSLLPVKGVAGVPPGPMTGDGIRLDNPDPVKSQKSVDLTLAMLDGLSSYDGGTLSSMGQERFWHERNMMWYGPGGIGTTRGLLGFQKNHQVPFITAFPDRGITTKANADQFAHYGDDEYTVDFGFPAMYGTHLGEGWLGLKATGKKCYPRVFDFWRREDDKLVENWVFIDMIHLLGELGYDVLAMLREQVLQRKNKEEVQLM